VNLENVTKAGKPPMKQSKNSVLTCEIMYGMFQQVMIMLMGIIGQAVLGLCKPSHRTQTVLAVEKQWGANSMRLWSQDEIQTMYAISLLKHVVALSKPEGSQKWLAPCCTCTFVHTVHRPSLLHLL
jgi:hypothetical protein